MSSGTKRTPPKTVADAHWQLVADSFRELAEEVGKDRDKWERMASLLHEACFGDERPYDLIEYDLRKLVEGDTDGSSEAVPNSGS